MQRIILHADLNNFYASVSCLEHPEYDGHPVAVGGDEEQRHGVVLAKNELAKSFGVRTGEALWEARQKCPELVVLPPHHMLYKKFSCDFRSLLMNYTDMVEPFGLDECWLDITHSPSVQGIGNNIADEIRHRCREKLEITCSIGLSYNKIFAKLGSDIKKPDATTVISQYNYRSVAWPLPVGNLLFVGPATEKKLRRDLNIHTIGQLAQENQSLLQRHFGKAGFLLWQSANGLDDAPVSFAEEKADMKSISNSVTTPRDLENDQDVRTVFAVLADSVSARLREQGVKAATIQIALRDITLAWLQRQAPLESPSFLTLELYQKAMQLFKACYDWNRHLPLRSLALRACNLTPIDSVEEQLSLFQDERRQRQEKLAWTVDKIRNRFGDRSIVFGVTQTDPDFQNINPRADTSLNTLV